MMEPAFKGLVSIPLSEAQCRVLRARRLALGMSVGALADRVGCSRRTIFRLENREVPLSSRMLSTICNELGLKWNASIHVTLQRDRARKRKANPAANRAKRKKKR
jgi:transcriptional regulator with XRE-family HTH domain